MRQYRCPVCGQKTDKKQCPSCGWDFTKDVAKGFLPAQMSGAACRVYMQRLQAQREKCEAAQKKNAAAVTEQTETAWPKANPDIQLFDSDTYQDDIFIDDIDDNLAEDIYVKPPSGKIARPKKKKGRFVKRVIMALMVGVLVSGAIYYGLVYLPDKNAAEQDGGANADTPGSTGSGADSTGAQSAGQDGADGYFTENSAAVAVSADYPPYAYYDDQGHIAGADIDILWEILLEDGVDEMTIIDIDSYNLSTMFGSGEANIAAGGITPTQERDQVMDFSDVYASAKIVIAMPEISTMTSVDEMGGSGVFGVLQGSLAQTSCEEHGYETLVYKDRESMWEDLASGLLDGVADDRIWIQQYMDMYGGFKILDGTLAEEDYVFAVAEGNQELLDEINTAIKQLKDAGKLDEMIEKRIELGDVCQHSS